MGLFFLFSFKIINNKKIVIFLLMDNTLKENVFSLKNDEFYAFIEALVGQ
jgi:hypothetical protein